VLASTCSPSNMNSLSLWLLLLFMLSGLPMACRGPNWVFECYSTPDICDNLTTNPGLFSSSNATKRITDGLVVAENIDTRGESGESDFIPVIKIYY